MDLLYTDFLIWFVDKYLSNNEKVIIISLSQNYNDLKYKLSFNDRVPLCNINGCPYYDNFTNIRMKSRIIKLPKNTKQLYISYDEDSELLKIPETITNLS